jgi:hypothetical protein
MRDEDQAVKAVLEGTDIEAEDGSMDPLEISRLRFQVSLIVLPYVGRHLEFMVDRALVVDDIAGQFLGWCEDGGNWDEFWATYVERIERGAGNTPAGEDPAIRLEQEWAWVNHAIQLREARGVK